MCKNFECMDQSALLLTTLSVVRLLCVFAYNTSDHDRLTVVTANKSTCDLLQLSGFAVSKPGDCILFSQHTLRDINLNNNTLY